MSSLDSDDRTPTPSTQERSDRRREAEAVENQSDSAFVQASVSRKRLAIQRALRERRGGESQD